MWMSVDLHLLCPSKYLNSKFHLIMVKCNKMCLFFKCVNIKGSFNMVMVNTTLLIPYKHK